MWRETKILLIDDDAARRRDLSVIFTFLGEELICCVRIPRPSGHPFHEHLATDSTVIRPPVPRASGH